MIRRITHTGIALLLAVALIEVCMVFFAVAAHGAATPVSLDDAAVAPSMLYYLGPGERIMVPEPQCKHGSYFTDISAYRWNGHALSGQQWTKDNLLTYWSARSGRRVTYNGIAFRNHTHGHVIVAGWCG
jgi:hypothetical protein